MSNGSPSITSSSVTGGPQVALTTNPAISNPTNAISVTIQFLVTPGTSALASTTCKLDSSAPATCVSPATFNNLAAGSHSLTVTATDANGLIGTANLTWTIAASSGPTLTFTPATGPVGTLITVTSSSFDLSKITSATVAGVEPLVISSSASNAVLFIMPGTTKGAISITTAAGTFTSSAPFATVASTPVTKQQGAKLPGTGTNFVVSSPQKLASVAVSADGNTAIVGGGSENGGIGGAWIYTRNGTTWSQQGSQLVGTGYVGTPSQGFSVAISADGNTAVLGAPHDNFGTFLINGVTNYEAVGAVWVFTRTGTSWSQQGSKLVASDAIPIVDVNGAPVAGAGTQIGYSVSISADGNTILAGGQFDDQYKGAAWIFVRNTGAWTQQGPKLVGPPSTANEQGYAVALSADGNTALIANNSGTPSAASEAGFIFTRTGTTWSQQAATLTFAGGSFTGFSVALSADGSTALFGGQNSGSTWVFTRTGATWTQQGGALIGSGNVGSSEQGYSVALSADGNTALIGGPGDNSNQGAAWLFTRSATTWTQLGAKLVGSGDTGAAYQGSAVALSADGNTAFVYGSADNSNLGAAWVFVP
jgi:hypothetical protein